MMQLDGQSDCSSCWHRWCLFLLVFLFVALCHRTTPLLEFHFLPSNFLAIYLFRHELIGAYHLKQSPAINNLVCGVEISLNQDLSLVIRAQPNKFSSMTESPQDHRSSTIPLFITRVKGHESKQYGQNSIPQYNDQSAGLIPRTMLIPVALSIASSSRLLRL